MMRGTADYVGDELAKGYREQHFAFDVDDVCMYVCLHSLVARNFWCGRNPGRDRNRQQG